MSCRIQGLPAGHMVQRPDSEDLEGGPSAAEGQCPHTRLVSSPAALSRVVVVQLCTSDGVEDLLDSLTIDSPKTPQEPEGHHRAGPAADHLQGEPSVPLSHLSLSPLCPTCLTRLLPVSPQTWTLALVRTWSWVRLFLRRCSRSSLWSTCRSGTLTWR